MTLLECHAFAYTYYGLRNMKAITPGLVKHIVLSDEHNPPTVVYHTLIHVITYFITCIIL